MPTYGNQRLQHPLPKKDPELILTNTRTYAIPKLCLLANVQGRMVFNQLYESIKLA